MNWYCKVQFQHPCKSNAANNKHNVAYDYVTSSFRLYDGISDKTVSDLVMLELQRISRYACCTVASQDQTEFCLTFEPGVGA